MDSSHKQIFKMAGARKADLLTFFCLYIAQSLPMTFFSTALQVTMRQASYSLSSIALLQIVKLPWVLKFFWSPMVDRRCTSLKGFRRCIFVSEGIYAAIILLVGHLNLQTDFMLIVTLIFFSFAASATQDIATDALAVLSFSHKEKGLVNSMQSLGSFSATLIGSGILLALLQRYGWHVVLPFMSLFVLIAILPLYRNKSLRVEPRQTDKPVSWSALVSFFTRRNAWPQIGFLVLCYAGIIGMLSMLRPWMVDLGFSMAQIGIISGVVGSAAACVASILSGHFIAYKGRRLARRYFAFVAFLATLYFFIISQFQPSLALIVIGIVLTWASYGLCTVVVYTTAMDFVRPGAEGTDFTIQTVITHLCGILMAQMCGFVADSWGYTALFATCSTLALASFLYTILWKRD